MKKKEATKVTRRGFIAAAVATAATTSAVSAEPKPVDAERQRLEELVERYGSEFGDLRKVT